MDRRELDLLLLNTAPDVGLEALQQSGELATLFPSVQAMVGFGGGDAGHKDLWGHTKQVVKQTRPDLLLRVAALFHDVGKPATITRYRRAGKNDEIGFPHHERVGARLFKTDLRASGVLSEDDIEYVHFILLNLGRVEAYQEHWTDSAVRRLSLELGFMAEAVLAVAEADCTTSKPAKRAAQLRRVGDLRYRIGHLRIAGAKLPALPKGLGTAVAAKTGLYGPELGVVLGDLKARVEAGELPRNAAIDVYLAAL